MDISFLVGCKEIGEIVKKVTASAGCYNADIHYGYFEDAVRIAKVLENSGTSVIISRWRTSQMIQENVSIPVIDIPLNGHDVARAILNASEISSKIALVGWPEVLDGIEDLAAFLGITIKMFSVKNKNNFENVIEEVKKANFEVVVGGLEAVETAEKKGLKGELLLPGEQAVSKALTDAIRILPIMQKKKTQNVNQLLIDNIDKGIVILNKQGLITNINMKARNFLGDKLDNFNFNNCLQGSSLEKLSEATKEKAEKIIIDNNVFLIKVVPMISSGTLMGYIVKLVEQSERPGDEKKKYGNLKNFAKYNFTNLIGKSAIFTKTVESAKKFSKVDSSVLLYGESGTGKELFAQSIHNNSLRSKGPFLAVNCAALPEDLLESELFGYAEGAFTGAKKGGKLGYFELAHKGTLFLDEASEMSLKLQARLLRVLEEREIFRIGDDKAIPVDVRIIAATNKNLKELVEKAQFREDLFYRLNVLFIKLPPLRECLEDIPLLCNFFIEEFSRYYNIEPKVLNDTALSTLLSYPWPGNIRELKNVIERLVVLTTQNEITERELEEVLEMPTQKITDAKGLIQNTEEQLILQTLENCNWNRKKASEKLGISIPTLWRKMKKLEERA